MCGKGLQTEPGPLRIYGKKAVLKRVKQKQGPPGSSPDIFFGLEGYAQ